MRFNTVPSISAQIVSWGNEEVVVRVPPGKGTVDVTIGNSNRVTFNYREPFIESVDPDSGKAGEIVRLTGKNFGVPQILSPSMHVKFDKSLVASAQAISWNDDEIIIKAPTDYGTGTNQSILLNFMGCVSGGEVQSEFVRKVIDIGIGGCKTLFDNLIEKYRLSVKPDFIEREAPVTVTTAAGISNFQNYTYQILAELSPKIVSSLRLIESPPYRVGQTITAQFSITSIATKPLNLDVLTVGGRLNGGCPLETCPDFEWGTNVQLSRDQIFDYEGKLKLYAPGNYHLFAAYRTKEGQWNAAIPTAEGVTNIKDIVVEDAQSLPRSADKPGIYSGKVVDMPFCGGEGTMYCRYLDVRQQSGEVIRTNFGLGVKIIKKGRVIYEGERILPDIGTTTSNADAKAYLDEIIGSNLIIGDTVNITVSCGGDWGCYTPLIEVASSEVHDQEPPRQPIILSIDGMCPMATFNIISNNICWTNYLKDALSPQLTQYLVTSFQWTGDTKETLNTLKYAEKFIKDFYKVAQNRGTTFQIVAHSWGTVLVYAILKANPDIKVDTLITLGSPLRSQEKLIIENYTNIYAGRNIQKLGNVNQWINYWAWNDLISGKIDIADKNVQIDTGIDNTDYQTRVIATRDFHSKYFTDWKYLIISDLSSVSNNNIQSEKIIAIQKDNLENTDEDLLFPIAFIKNMQYYEISVSALNEREVTSKDLQVKSLLSNVRQYMMISDGVKTGTFNVSNVKFREGLACDNAYIPEGKIQLIQEMSNYRQNSNNTLFLSTGNTTIMNNKFIPVKGIASNHINNITNLVKTKFENLKVTNSNNIDASSLKLEYLKAYDLENDGHPELFLVGSSVRLHKAVFTDESCGPTNEVTLFMIVCLERNQYRILYSSEPSYEESNLIGAADIDGDGNIEIVINSGRCEAWDFEIYRFQNGILEKLYSGTGYGC